MRKITDLDRVKIYEHDDSVLEGMINECNQMIDRFESLEDQESAEGKDLKVNILNYKNKIAKIRNGY
ncbi:hypothetical protein Q0590_20720 [Rhodocytophaga aerolata]|uniref:Uncharacterized protein n=1 Tax=Rhodocytophaga aerolata TaxID=455078 RepID=A0ABT8R9E1_9BACT|nr:hypothetical protein [Rhodocytophaga aerolata]MDO1448713.1 hypothetical protein [Rhodocytophaga aerolata]